VLKQDKESNRDTKGNKRKRAKENERENKKQKPIKAERR
jgi:hypothetical protein